MTNLSARLARIESAARMAIIGERTSAQELNRFETLCQPGQMVIVGLAEEAAAARARASDLEAALRTTVDDIYASDPDFTGPLSTDEYVRKLRDDSDNEVSR